MGWWRFWEKDDKSSRSSGTAAVESQPSRAPRQRSSSGPETSDPAAERRIAQLRRRRDAILFDVHQGEVAQQPQNPWQERIDLLEEALASVDADERALEATPKQPSTPLPPTPISNIRVNADEPAKVDFAIGDEPFHFSEEIDWDERGGAVVRGDLRQRTGFVDNLLATDFPEQLRAAAIQHLTDSIAVFATDLRDRALSGQPLPSDVTLADLARVCGECGGWTDWHGRCPDCTARDLKRNALKAEAARLQAEQARESEERHRLAEALPIARRRLAAVDAELASLTT